MVGHTGGLEEDFRFNVVAFTTFFKHFAQPCLFRHFDKRAVGKNVETLNRTRNQSGVYLQIARQNEFGITQTRDSVWSSSSCTFSGSLIAKPMQRSARPSNNAWLISFVVPSTRFSLIWGKAERNFGSIFGSMTAPREVLIPRVSSPFRKSGYPACFFQSVLSDEAEPWNLHRGIFRLR